MGKLICPLCGAFTSFTPDAVEVSWDEQGTRVDALVPCEDGQPGYGVLVCQACGKRFVAEERSEGRRPEWIAVYPIPHKPVPKEVPQPMRSEFEEAYLCFAVGAYRACVSMCMTTLEALWRDKGLSGLNELKERGTISTQLHQRATEIRLWANLTKHEPIPGAVEREDAEQLVAYLELVLNAVYVEPARLAALTKKRERLEKGDKPKSP